VRKAAKIDLFCEFFLFERDSWALGQCNNRLRPIVLERPPESGTAGQVLCSRRHIDPVIWSAWALGRAAKRRKAREHYERKQLAALEAKGRLDCDAPMKGTGF